MNDKNIINLEEDETIIEIKRFLPIITDDKVIPYFEKMFQNLCIIEGSEFYNNAILNLTHFYNYLIRTYLVRLYNSNNQNIELLKYIQITEGCLSPLYSNENENDRTICIEDKTDIFTFRAKERKAIRYFFHILNIDENSCIFKYNEKIFQKRNNVAHLQYYNITKDEFDEFSQNILHGLTNIATKLVSITKQIIKTNIENYKSQDLISDDIYDIQNVLEKINKEYYISEMDYYLINKQDGSIKSAPKTSDLYWVKRYCLEILGLEF